METILWRNPQILGSNSGSIIGTYIVNSVLKQREAGSAPPPKNKRKTVSVTEWHHTALRAPSSTASRRESPALHHWLQPSTAQPKAVGVGLIYPFSASA